MNKNEVLRKLLASIAEDASEPAHRRIVAAKALATQPAQPTDERRSAAYDAIDRFLRNNLGDDDYAEYAAALETLYAAPADQAQLAEQAVAPAVSQEQIEQANAGFAELNKHNDELIAENLRLQEAETIDPVQYYATKVNNRTLKARIEELEAQVRAITPQGEK